MLISEFLVGVIVVEINEAIAELFAELGRMFGFIMASLMAIFPLCPNYSKKCRCGLVNVLDWVHLQVWIVAGGGSICRCFPGLALVLSVRGAENLHEIFI